MRNKRVRVKKFIQSLLDFAIDVRATNKLVHFFSLAFLSMISLSFPSSSAFG